MNEQNKIYQSESSTIYAIDKNTIGKLISTNSEKITNFEIQNLQYVNQLCDYFPKFKDLNVLSNGDRLICMERLNHIYPKSFSKAELLGMIEELYLKITFLHKSGFVHNGNYLDFSKNLDLIITSEGLKFCDVSKSLILTDIGGRFFEYYKNKELNTIASLKYYLLNGYPNDIRYSISQPTIVSRSYPVFEGDLEI